MNVGRPRLALYDAQRRRSTTASRMRVPAPTFDLDHGDNSIAFTVTKYGNEVTTADEALVESGR